MKLNLILKNIKNMTWLRFNEISLGDDEMWNEPTKKQLELIPKLYETDGVPLEDKKVYMKFFMGAWTWYVMEYDGKDTFFGLVISPMTQPNGELGYFSLSELKSLKQGFVQVDREIHGIQPRTPKYLREIKI